MQPMKQPYFSSAARVVRRADSRACGTAGCSGAIRVSPPSAVKSDDRDAVAAGLPAGKHDIDEADGLAGDPLSEARDPCAGADLTV